MKIRKDETALEAKYDGPSYFIERQKCDGITVKPDRHQKGYVGRLSNNRRRRDLPEIQELELVIATGHSAQHWIDQGENWIPGYSKTCIGCKQGFDDYDCDSPWCSVDCMIKSQEKDK